MTAHHCVADLSSDAGVTCSDTFGSTRENALYLVTPSYDAASAAFNGPWRWPTADNSTWFKVQGVQVPPGSGTACGWDMALLELSAAIPGVCPLVPRVDSAPQVGETYTAIGFGRTSPDGPLAGTRYAATDLKVQRATTCGRSKSVTYEWCGASDSLTEGTCEGDSGGPAIDSGGRVLGAVARGPNDCSFTIYTGVYGWRTWIQEVAQTAATNGGYAPAGWVTGASTSDPSSGYCDGGFAGLNAWQPPPGDSTQRPKDSCSATTGAVSPHAIGALAVLFMVARRRRRAMATAS
jgi:MYXO-CTERM domain-containing protein